jgi:hypothetical protein
VGKKVLMTNNAPLCRQVKTTYAPGTIAQTHKVPLHLLLALAMHAAWAARMPLCVAALEAPNNNIWSKLA